MKSLKSLSNEQVMQRFQQWGEAAPLEDLKAALTALNLTYQRRVTVKPLHPNQFNKLNPLVPDTLVRHYEGEADDEPINEAQLYGWFVKAFIKQTEIAFSFYLQKVKREVRRPYLNSNCPECGVKMTEPSRHAPTMITVDHIIPVWVCKAVEYYHGIVDPKNMRVMCYNCNALRGGRISTIADLRKDLGNKPVDTFFKKVHDYLPLSYSHIQ